MIAVCPPRIRPDAATLLARLLAARAAAADVAWAVRDWRTRPWASATFVGDRHEVLVTLGGEAAPAFAAALPEADLPVRGHLVADCAVSPVGNDLWRIAVLTLTDF